MGARVCKALRLISVLQLSGDRGRRGARLPQRGRLRQRRGWRRLQPPNHKGPSEGSWHLGSLHDAVGRGEGVRWGHIRGWAQGADWGPRGADESACGTTDCHCGGAVPSSSPQPRSSSHLGGPGGGQQEPQGLRVCGAHCHFGLIAPLFSGLSFGRLRRARASPLRISSSLSLGLHRAGAPLGFVCEGGWCRVQRRWL